MFYLNKSVYTTATLREWKRKILCSVLFDIVSILYCVEWILIVTAYSVGKIAEKAVCKSVFLTT